MPEITSEIIKAVDDWLGEEGRAFFRECLETHGEIGPVIATGSIPHPVHWREGMQVRNTMRKSGLCNDWNDHDLDDNWEEVVEECLKLHN
jgi:hypothetical protein